MKKQSMVSKAVILAGGKGTRLYPVTEYTPKPLLFVWQKPILNYLVDLFLRYEVNDIALLVSRDFREEFEWWKRRYYDTKLQIPNQPQITIFEEKKPLGTFGGLHFLKDWAGREHFFVTNGDELKDLNLRTMAEFHTEQNAVGTIALVRVPNPQDYGVVLTNGHVVEAFLEKPENPPSEYINSGLYLLSPEIFTYHPGPKFLMFEKDVFPKLTEEKKLVAFKFDGRWADCGTWERYIKALEEWNR